MMFVHMYMHMFMFAYVMHMFQLFIMLGNDRANEFWAARLPAADEIDCDASPEQRREFITQKYREGHFRYPHPSFGTQEELLKVRNRQ